MFYKDDEKIKCDAVINVAEINSEYISLYGYAVIIYTRAGEIVDAWTYTSSEAGWSKDPLGYYDMLATMDIISKVRDEMKHVEKITVYPQFIRTINHIVSKKKEWEPTSGLAKQCKDIFTNMREEAVRKTVAYPAMGFAKPTDNFTAAKKRLCNNKLLAVMKERQDYMLDKLGITGDNNILNSHPTEELNGN